MKTDREFYREQILMLIPEFHESKRMLCSQSIVKHNLKWGVVYEGQVALREKISKLLNCLGGMAGEW